MMIALASKDNTTVRLDSNLDVARETAEFFVAVSGSKYLYRKFTFADFSDAAKVYKYLSGKLDEGTYTDEVADNVTMVINLHSILKEVS